MIEIVIDGFQRVFESADVLVVEIGTSRKAEIPIVPCDRCPKACQIFIRCQHVGHPCMLQTACQYQIGGLIVIACFSTPGKVGGEVGLVVFFVIITIIVEIDDGGIG